MGDTGVFGTAVTMGGLELTSQIGPTSAILHQQKNPGDYPSEEPPVYSVMNSFLSLISARWPQT